MIGDLDAFMTKFHAWQTEVNEKLGVGKPADGTTQSSLEGRVMALEGSLQALHNRLDKLQSTATDIRSTLNTPAPNPVSQQGTTYTGAESAQTVDAASLSTSSSW